MLPLLEPTRAATPVSRTPELEARWGRIVAGLRPAPRRRLRWEPFGKRPSGWGPDILLALSFLAMGALMLWRSPLVEIDVWVREWVYHHKVPWLVETSIAVTHLGLGRAVAPVVLALALWTSFRYRSVRPLLLYSACFASLAAVLGMKILLGRPKSHHPFQLHEISSDGPILFNYIWTATAFPSGHAVNSIVFYALAVMLVGALIPTTLRWFVIVAPPVLMIASQTYAGWHWLFDAPAGFAIGLLIVRGARRVPWSSVPLGPLACFEPASTRTLLGITALIVCMLLASTLLNIIGVIIGLITLGIGLAWWTVRFIAYRRARRDEREQALAS